MIRSFGDKGTRDLFHGVRSREARKFPPDMVRVALRKLDVINTAYELKDLRSSPGNRLKPLKGKLKGFHSIRINDQWRIIFRWDAGDVFEVRITDYH